jgi:predicted nucleotidyltransferase
MLRKTIFKLESGSYLYGTNTESSDKDYISVFIPTNYDLLSLQKCEFIDESTKNSSEDRRNTSEDIDNHQYSISNYLRLVLQGNPNLTETLFATQPIVLTEEFRIFKDNPEKLISRGVYNSFTGFAVSQKKKLEYKAQRFNQLSQSLSHLEDNYATQIADPDAGMGEQLASWLNENLTAYKGGKHTTNSFHKNLPLKIIYEKIKKEYEDYGWRSHTDTFTTLGYDVKFASHAIRLYHEGAALLNNGRLEFPISGKAFDDIMAVKNGKLSLEQFYTLCDEYEELNRKAYEKTILPPQADWKWANSVLVRLLENSIMGGVNQRIEDFFESLA